MKKLLKYLKDEEGLVAIEYAIIATFVALVIITGTTALGLNLDAMFQSIADTIATW
jgi:pilus assembly protein Flp/PilA